MVVIDMDFGSCVGSIVSVIDQIFIIIIICLKCMLFMVVLDNGLYVGGISVWWMWYVINVVYIIFYELYCDSVCILCWGIIQNVDIFVQMGIGSVQLIIVYGCVLVMVGVVVEGSYNDCVQVIIMFQVGGVFLSMVL